MGMTEHQKAVQNELRKLEDSNRTLAWYESRIRELEFRIQRADQESAIQYRKEVDVLKSEKSRFSEDVWKAKKMIDSCTDPRGRQILYSRYIDLKRMEDIAYIMSYERTHLYRIYYKALESIIYNK